MLPFGVTIPATVPQGSEIPEGLMNNPVYVLNFCSGNVAVKYLRIILRTINSTFSFHFDSDNEPLRLYNNDGYEILPV
jgi:hypothetical protein